MRDAREAGVVLCNHCPIRELLIRKGLYWNSLPFGEFLWIRMGIHLRIYKDSPNGTEFQGMNRTPFFDPKKGVPGSAAQPTIGIGRNNSATSS